MKIDTYKCDECGTQKGEINHWFRLRPSPTWADKGPWVSILGWTTDYQDKDMHLCSDACVIKSVQKWLSAQQASKEGK